MSSAKNIPAFLIKVDGKILNYRNGQNLNLDNVHNFFCKKYKIDKIWSGGRHVLGILEKDNKKFFLKLATTPGVSAVTQNEYNWNELFNKIVGRRSKYLVPTNYTCGFFKNDLFYMITEDFEGKLLTPIPKQTVNLKLLKEDIEGIISFTQLIEGLNPQQKLLFDVSKDYRRNFLKKTDLWFKSIPHSVCEKYAVGELLDVVNQEVDDLEMAPRHGDFAPWHLFKLKDGQLGLIDGEHAMVYGVKNYDIAYFIQRVFSVLKNPKLANSVLKLLDKENYKIKNIKTILTARAIGGFLDEYLSKKPDYSYAVKFKKWVRNL